MNRIEVDKDEFVRYIVEHCSHYFYNFAEGACCRRKVSKETCGLHAFSDELHCPDDCPRLNTEDYGCDKGKCPLVKAVIKKLKI